MKASFLDLVGTSLSDRVSQKLILTPAMSYTSMLITAIRNKSLSSLYIMFMVAGTVGNVLNIILFKQRHLRTLSPGITFLLAASVANLVDIYTFILSQIFSKFNIAPALYSSSYCKLQIYLYYTSFCLSSWYMVGCCADRFFASSQSAVVRRYSSIRTTHRIVLAITITLLLVYSPILYCYDANQIQKPSPCYPQNRVCEMIDLTFYFIFQSIGPPVCILILGIGTFMHIRQGRHVRQNITNTVTVSVIPVTSTNTRNIKKDKRSILYMLIAQVILYIVCSLPLLAFKIYSNIPLSIIKSDVRLSVENIIQNVGIWFSFVDKIFSFYIYTLSSHYFRGELIKLVPQRCRPQRIEPRH
jgi:hypothetical protein